MPTSKQLFQLLNNTGQLVTGATLTAVSTTVGTVYSFTEPDPTNYPGHYVLVAPTDTYNLFVGGVLQSSLSPFLHIDSSVIPQPLTSQTQYFGDGSDLSYTLDGSQATVSGLFTKDSSTHYTLARDAYFLNLTINAGIILATAGFRLHASGTLTNNGNIDNSGPNGNNGTDASGATPGSGGAQPNGAASQYLVAPSTGPAAGGAGATTGNGTAAIGPNSQTGCIGVAGVAGGAGGNGGAGGSGAGGTGGGAGPAGTATALPVADGGVRNIFNAYLNRVFGTTSVVAVYINGIGGSGSGGGAGGTGASGTRGAGGGGGSGGANGGTILLCANTIVGTGTVTANGGVGGNGGKGGNATTNYGSGGGGGAGSGGPGGAIFVLYRTNTSTVTFTAAGGAAGTPGAAGTGGNASGVIGGTPSAAPAGVVIQFQI